MSPSIWQLLIVLAIVVVLFGTKRLGNVGNDLGNAIKSFKNAMGEHDDDKDRDKDDEAERLGRADESRDHQFERDSEGSDENASRRK